MAPGLERLNHRLTDSSTVPDAGLAIENCKKLESGPAEWEPEEQAEQARAQDLPVSTGLADSLS